MYHKKCGVLGWICLIILIIGGLTWGIIGVFNWFNWIHFVIGAWPIWERIAYIIIGIAAIIKIFLACGCGRKCKKCAHTETGAGPTVPPT